MNRAPIPYFLRPRATQLAAGPDASLDPTTAPMDAERRSAAPFDWAAVDQSKGGTAPPDAALAPPPVDPAQRSEPPFVWPFGAAGIVTPNRPLRETTSPLGDLDPDIALWPAVVVSIWPFAGAPTVGVWPKGWFGIDNTAQPYVCVAGGQPGTWSPVGFSSAGVASFNTRTGAVTFTAADAESVFTGAHQVLLGTGSGTGAIVGTGGARVYVATNQNAFFPQGSNVTIPFDTVDFSVGSTVSTATSHSLVINQTGLYDVSAQVYIQENTNATRYVTTVLRNGSNLLANDASADASFASNTLSSPVSLTAGDVLTVISNVSGGTGSANLIGSSYNTFLGAVLLAS